MQWDLEPYFGLLSTLYFSIKTSETKKLKIILKSQKSGSNILISSSIFNVKAKYSSKK